MVALSYAEMIEEAILGLGEMLGSSRPAIWKAISAKHHDADYKQFVVRLKKMRDAGFLAQNKGKFRLEINYKHKLLKALEQGRTHASVVNKSGASKKKRVVSSKAKKSKKAGSSAAKKAKKQANK
jgi:hypothetical protein